jgi:hypothetical protein
MEARLIELLRSYGPVSSSDTLCDENVGLAEATYGVEPIRTAAARLDDIGTALLEGDGRSVILTGTAGDGKTYHIRAFFERHFPERMADWPGNDGVMSVPLHDGRELRVIRDLSEVSDGDKQAELSSFASALLRENDRRLYLVAANDGQLLKYFRDAVSNGGSSSKRYRDIQRALSTMMREEREEDQGLALRLINLSRTWEPGLVDRIFDAVLRHPAWQDQCGTCVANSDGRTCPIRLNRSLLIEEEDRPSVFRQRLRESLRLAACNDQHVPIRQLLTLVVNIVLGDAKNPDRPLLDCATARRRASHRDYRYTNPYDNALGLNLRPERRRANRVFNVFEVFGVGLETNNLVDGMLVQGEPADLHARLFDEEKTYGADLFDGIRRAYLGGGGSDQAVDAFRKELKAQRRRAFFRLSGAVEGDQASPWRLTIFQHGGEYLKLLDALASGAGRGVTDPYARQLVKGLNRAFTGMMANDENHLWLAGTIGKTDDPAGRVCTIDRIERSSSTNLGVRLSIDPVTRRPALGLSLPPVMKSDRRLPLLDLRPLLFEYLMRVAGGSLPASFSRQCHQEIRHFALVTVAAVQELFAQDEPGPEVVRVLSLGTQGDIQASRIEI